MLVEALPEKVSVPALHAITIPFAQDAGMRSSTCHVQLILRSINSSRSAYASISFINTFFDAYNIFGATVVQAGVLAKVKILAASVYGIDSLSVCRDLAIRVLQ